MKTTLALALFVLALIGCSVGPSGPPGSPSTTSPPGSATPSPSATPPTGISHPTGADELVLRVATSGGLMGPGSWATELPFVSVYGDGRVITLGPQIEIFPGPALPNLQVARISPAGMQRLLEAARAAGLLGGDRHLDLPGIADAGTTSFTVVAGGRTHTVSAYALGLESGMDEQLSAEDRVTRRALLAFRGALGDPRSLLGSDVVADGEEYRPTGMRIVAMPATAPAEPGTTAREWPIEPELGSFGEPLGGLDMRCGVVDGDDLAELMPHLREANQLTRWESGGDPYVLSLRPLLPDEEGCPTR